MSAFAALGRRWVAGLGMRRVAATALLLAAAPPGLAEPQKETLSSPTISALAKAVREGDGGAVARFWAQLERAGTPLIEAVPASAVDQPVLAPARMLVTFVARDDAESNVAVHVPMNDDMPRLTHIPGTDVWTRTFELSSGGRGPYALVWPKGRAKSADSIYTYAREGKPVYEMFRDPLAARRSPWVMEPSRPPGEISWFEGPAASKQPYLEARRGVRPGRLITRTFASRILGNERLVSIYTPAGYGSKPARPYDLALFFDREDFLTSMQAATLLDNLIADEVIPPLVALFVSPIDNDTRSRELPGYSPFQDFILHELMPEIRSTFAVTSDPKRSAVGGASYGGLSAMLLALRAPEVFANVVSLSGSYWWGPKLVGYDYSLPMPEEAMALPARVAATPKVPERVFMNVGLWEGEVMRVPNRHLRDVLIARGSVVTYDEFEGGHDWISWRAALPEALAALLGRKSADAR